MRKEISTMQANENLREKGHQTAINHLRDDIAEMRKDMAELKATVLAAVIQLPQHQESKTGAEMALLPKSPKTTIGKRKQVSPLKNLSVAQTPAAEMQPAALFAAAAGSFEALATGGEEEVQMDVSAEQSASPEQAEESSAPVTRGATAESAQWQPAPQKKQKRAGPKTTRAGAETRQSTNAKNKNQQ
jgi:hypothetical protein